MDVVHSHPGPPMSSTEYLSKRRQTWFVRLVVPPLLRATVGRRELIRTTKTHDLAVANRVKHASLQSYSAN
jgi:hypothetical protein